MKLFKKLFGTKSRRVYICISFFIVLDCKVLNNGGRRETTFVVLQHTIITKTP